MPRLHLGCGNVHLDSFINVDYRYQPGVDVVDNIGTLRRYQPNSIDEIYSCHALDHFDRYRYKTILVRWFELLRKGGILRLSMPDFKQIAKVYRETGDCSSIQGALYAGQEYENNHRHFIWDFEMAKGDLSEVGFANVIKVYPKYDDCSLAQIANIPISLNITGEKP